MMKKIVLLALGLFTLSQAQAQNSSSPHWWPKVQATLRTKGEWQPQQESMRFEVRNARVSFSGEALRGLTYKAEMDLSDEGQFKTLDAFGEFAPLTAMGQKSKQQLKIRMGQFRVPFSIEPHRSPHLRFFANRSFVAKHLANVRDVGLQVSYSSSWGSNDAGRWELKAGLFNGSGITGQKHFWTSSLNYAARLQVSLPLGLMATASTLKLQPACGSVWLYDGSLTYQRGSLFLEAEYLEKHYAHQRFPTTRGFNLQALYDFPLGQASDHHQGLFDRLSLRARYDYMSDHSDGSSLDETGQWARLTDVKRGRLTRGMTLHFAQKYSGKAEAYLHLNYEK